MPTLATIDDYYAFRGEPVPALDAEQEAVLLAKLSRASTRVKLALRLANYARASDGLPAAASQRQALRDAVSAEHDAISAAGGDYTGAEPVFDQVSAIGVQFSSRSTKDAWTAQRGLSPEAQAILLEAGFFSTVVEH